MAGKIVKQQSGTISAATATGYITIGSVSGFYESAICNLSNTGQPSREVIVTEVLTGTNQLGIRFRQQIVDYGQDDVSAYNGGSIHQPSQLIYNPNDAPLT